MNKAKGSHNYQALMKTEQLIEQLGYGVIDVSTEFHNSKVTKQTFYGKERRMYPKNEDALVDIVKRIKKNTEAGETTRLHFAVDVRRGRIHTVVWTSEMDVFY